MAFIIRGVDPKPFQPLFGLSDEDLAAHGAVRKRVNVGDGVPERSELIEAPVGSEVLLVNFTYQPASNPFHGRHAIYLKEWATEQAAYRDTVPEVIRTRLISLRAFDHGDMLVAADTVNGRDIESRIEEFFERPDVAYLHAHYAKPGCFAAYVSRG